MASVKHLKPEEYSEVRKQAMEEVKEQKKLSMEQEALVMKEAQKAGKVMEKNVERKKFKSIIIKCTSCNKEKQCSGDRYEKLVNADKVKDYKCRDCRKKKP